MTGSRQPDLRSSEALSRLLVEAGGVVPRGASIAIVQDPAVVQALLAHGGGARSPAAPGPAPPPGPRIGLSYAPSLGVESRMSNCV